MKLRNYISVLGAGSLLLLGLPSCDDFLSTLPDNRAELKSYEDIRSLLITAYPENGYMLSCEMSSDNVTHNVEADANTTRFLDQLYEWADVTETDNESPKRIWESCYGFIQKANAAIDAIDEAGNPAELKALRGEALMCRAFGHFILVNLFSEAYDPATASSKLGVPYNFHPEKTLNPQYTRATLASNFENIAKDIEEGLPLISDDIYKAPKYHFNHRAAQAFAARFYLYYQKWDLAKKYADAVIGANPKGQLRDYDFLSTLPTGGTGFKNMALKWVDSSSPNNLLLTTAYSRLGYIYGFYIQGSRFTHSTFVADHETTRAENAWGTTEFKVEPARLTDPYRKAIFPRYPAQFEYEDRIAGTGFIHTTNVEFTTDETLLVRAEAEIMLGDKVAALADMNAYIANIYKSSKTMTEAMIKDWNKKTPYATPEVPTARKALNPSWTITPEQEEYLQVLLHLRRIETLHSGLRWFDIKRYGIEITRVDITNGMQITVTSNVLKKDDKRRALQLPAEVISAGLVANRK